MVSAAASQHCDVRQDGEQAGRDGSDDRAGLAGGSDEQKEDATCVGRYADRFIDARQDLIFGVSLNNNPSVQDAWNSAPAWGFTVVPGSNPNGLPAAPLLNGGLAQQVIGAGTYVYWNKLLYAEVAAYTTADKSWSFLSRGTKFSDGSRNRLVVEEIDLGLLVAQIAEWRDFPGRRHENTPSGGAAMAPCALSRP